MDYRVIPAVVYSIPEVVAVGTVPAGPGCRVFKVPVHRQPASSHRGLRGGLRQDLGEGATGGYAGNCGGGAGRGRQRVRDDAGTHEHGRARARRSTTWRPSSTPTPPTPRSRGRCWSARWARRSRCRTSKIADWRLATEGQASLRSECRSSAHVVPHAIARCGISGTIGAARHVCPCHFSHRRSVHALLAVDLPATPPAVEEPADPVDETGRSPGRERAAGRPCDCSRRSAPRLSADVGHCRRCDDAAAGVARRWPTSRGGRKAGGAVVSQGELLGLISLGPRRSDQEYSSDDRRLLADLASRAAPSVRVAQLVRQQR